MKNHYHNRGNPSKLPDKETLYRLSQIMTATEVARMYGVSAVAVYENLQRYRRLHNLPLRSNNHPLSTLPLQLMATWREQGLSPQEIAAKIKERKP